MTTATHTSKKPSRPGAYIDVKPLTLHVSTTMYAADLFSLFLVMTPSRLVQRKSPPVTGLATLLLCLLLAPSPRIFTTSSTYSTQR